MKLPKRHFILAACYFISPLASAEIVSSEKDEKITTYCECLIAFSGCESEFLASSAGKPVHSWYQENYLSAGEPADLNAACYRKRDVEDRGDGLCCTIDSDETETIRRLFRGTRQ